MLDKDNISNVCGIITKKEVLKEISEAQLQNILCLTGNYFRGKYELVEEEFSQNEKEHFNCVKVGESKTKYYYVSINGEAFSMDKRTNKKYTLRPFTYPSENAAKIRIANKELSVKNLVAYNFIPGTSRNDVIYHKDGNIFNCAADNLIVVSRKKHMASIAGTGRAKKIGLFENGQLIKTWSSARKCSREIFVSTSGITAICNNKVKGKLVDVRWI